MDAAAEKEKTASVRYEKCVQIGQNRRCRGSKRRKREMKLAACDSASGEEQREADRVRLTQGCDGGVGLG